MIEWKNLKTLITPFSDIAADGPVSWKIYAQYNGHKEKNGWNRFNSMETSEKISTQIRNRSTKLGSDTTRKHEQAIILEKSNGETFWEDDAELN